MKTLIIIVGGGRIRCVRRKPAGDDPAEKEHLIEEEAIWLDGPALDRSEVATDQSGRFSRGGPAGLRTGMSYGEEHNLELDLERQALHDIVARISEILTEDGRLRWILAAPRAILRRLENALPAECSRTLVETIGGDLTKKPIAALEQRFLAGT